MKNATIKLLILVLLLFTLEKINSQTIISDTSELSEYFADRTTEAKNIIKINVLSIFAGDLPIYYERVITKQFTLEAGVGIILPFYVFEFSGLYSEEQIITDPDGGYSFWFHPKIYFWRAPDEMYFGLQYRFRKYYENDMSVTYSDYSINYGYQWILGTHFVVDANIGLGFRVRNLPDDFDPWVEDYKKTTVVAPFGIKLGVLF